MRPRGHKGLYESAWSTSTHPFDLNKVSWALGLVKQERLDKGIVWLEATTTRIRRYQRLS